MSSTSIGPRWLVTVAAGLLRRPDLWSTAARTGLLLAAPGWWRRPPHLPMPDPSYLRFRHQTMYGDADEPPALGDVVTYLEWCKSFEAI